MLIKRILGLQGEAGLKVRYHIRSLRPGQGRALVLESGEQWHYPAGSGGPGESGWVRPFKCLAFTAKTIFAGQHSN